MSDDENGVPEGGTAEDVSDGEADAEVAQIEEEERAGEEIPEDVGGEEAKGGSPEAGEKVLEEDAGGEEEGVGAGAPGEEGGEEGGSDPREGGDQGEVKPGGQSPLKGDSVGQKECALCDGSGRHKRTCVTNCDHVFYEGCWGSYAINAVPVTPKQRGIVCPTCGEKITSVASQTVEGRKIKISYQRILYKLCVKRKAPLFMLAHKLFNIPYERLKIVAGGQAFVEAREEQLEQLLEAKPDTTMFVVGQPVTDQQVAAERAAAAMKLKRQQDKLERKLRESEERARVVREDEERWRGEEIQRLRERRAQQAAQAPSTLARAGGLWSRFSNAVRALPLVSAGTTALGVVTLFVTSFVSPYEHQDDRMERREREEIASRQPGARRPIGTLGSDKKPPNFKPPMGGG